MELTNLFTMFGGLALFLYGMNMMSTGLELAAGNKLKSILEKLTANRFLGVAVGALITALIQSSSATTVMVVGFVNAGLMTLNSAVWVIMGANIGTTITGQLIAINMTALAGLIALVGVGMIVFFKSKKLDAYGQVLGGLGILFIGMETMSGAMAPLRDVPEFVNLMTQFQNPVIGIIAGAVFTAVIQSSSASVGILQALAKSGVISLPSAIYVLFGQNIGTCITALIASIGTTRNAKRTTILHLSFNIIGTVIFVLISLITPFASFMESLTPYNVASQIANVHTVFNVVTTLILLPFGKQLVGLSFKILPEQADQEETCALRYLDFSIFENDYHIGTSAIAHTQLFNETQNMLDYALENVRKSFELIETFDDQTYNDLEKNEANLNYLNQQIVDYTTCAISSEMPLDHAKSIGLFLKVSADLERIGDHAVNIAQKAKDLSFQHEHFSVEAMDEIGVMDSLCTHILSELKIMNYQDFKDIVDKVDVIEDNIDKTQEQFAMNQLIRLKNKRCTTENSVLFTQILIDFERIGDHGLNIAKSFFEIKEDLAAMKMKTAAQ